MPAEPTASPGISGGERQGTREKMDRMVGHLVSHGTDLNKAKEIARNEAIKEHDGRGVRRR